MNKLGDFGVFGGEDVRHVFRRLHWEHATPGVTLIVSILNHAGKPIATTAGPPLARWVAAHRGHRPPFLAGALTLAGQRAQGTRIRLYACRYAPPIKLRCACDELYARCELRGVLLLLKASKTSSRIASR